MEDEMNNVLDHALALADMGVPVFPCLHNKGPATGPGGLYNATTDPKLVALWFGYHERLVGVPMGKTTGMTCVDIDPRNGGEVWARKFDDKLPMTRCHGTRGGGWHIFFRYRPGLPSKLADGVDIKTDGGYIIWWPASGCKVVHHVALDALAELPEWVIPEPSDMDRRHIYKPGSISPDRIKVEQLYYWVAGAKVGERNKRLFWAACRLGEMLDPYDNAMEILFDAAQRVGFDQSFAAAQARRTIASGLTCPAPRGT
jgi:hypothetical protein